MGYLYAKLKNSGKHIKIRKILYTDHIVFPSVDEIVQERVEYNPQTLLEDGAWYVLKVFSMTPYAIDIIKEEINSSAYDDLTPKELKQVEYFFTVSSNKNELCFQRVGRSALVRKRMISFLNNTVLYDPNSASITVKDYPDAIYKKDEDILLFRELSLITAIFKGVGDLYREATKEEICQFFDMEFVVADGIVAERVTVPNRKKIASALQVLKQLNESETNDIGVYIADYCPELKRSDNGFKITNNDELSKLLYGIEQRFYTTPVSKEKRIANSIIKL